MTNWYYAQDGGQAGPVTIEALQAMVRGGELRPHDMVWREGMAQWQPAGQVAEVMGSAVPPPLPLPPVSTGPPAIPYASYRPREQTRDLGEDAGMRMLLPVGRSGWAIAAGYLGLFSIMVLPAPVAIIISIIAIRDIRSDKSKHGMGRAVFGLVMGILGCLAAVLMVVLMFVSMPRR